MEQWSAFLQDRWYLILLAVVILLLVVKLVKTAVKWLVILIVAAGVLVYGYQYKEDLKQLPGSIPPAIDALSNVDEQAQLKDQAMVTLIEEVQNAVVEKKTDGTYTLKTNSLQISGSSSSEEVTVTLKGKTFQMKMFPQLKDLIDQAANKSK